MPIDEQGQSTPPSIESSGSSLTARTVLVKNGGHEFLPLVDSAIENVRIPTDGLATGETLAWSDEHRGAPVLNE